MMEWLSDWLKQVILIILLAAFVDLLLPNQAMQRYVKTVVSLFILMTLLTPVFELFQRGWDAEKLLAEAERLQSDNGRQTASGGLVPNGGKLKTLEGILADAEKLKADNGQEARKLAERRLAEEMKAGLEKATGVQVVVLEASIEEDNQGNPAISKVRAVLSHKQESQPEPSGKGRTNSIGGVQVEEVKPVMIQIHPSTPVSGRSAEEGMDSGQEELRADSIRYFKQEWMVAAERLDIRIHSGQSQ